MVTGSPLLGGRAASTLRRDEECLKLYLHSRHAFMACKVTTLHWSLLTLYFILYIKQVHCWIKTDQLDVTCSIISLFNSQHVSNVSTSILRSLRLICWVISWVVLLWFDVCWCYVVVWLGWCGIRMQAEALVPSGSHRACNGITLPFLLFLYEFTDVHVCKTSYPVIHFNIKRWINSQVKKE